MAGGRHTRHAAAAARGGSERQGPRVGITWPTHWRLNRSPARNSPCRRRGAKFAHGRCSVVPDWRVQQKNILRNFPCPPQLCRHQPQNTPRGAGTSGGPSPFVRRRSTFLRSSSCRAGRACPDEREIHGNSREFAPQPPGGGRRNWDEASRRRSRPATAHSAHTASRVSRLRQIQTVRVSVVDCVRYRVERGAKRVCAAPKDRECASYFVPHEIAQPPPARSNSASVFAAAPFRPPASSTGARRHRPPPSLGPSPCIAGSE